jgi:hypothetical protein
MRKPRRHGNLKYKSQPTRSSGRGVVQALLGDPIQSPNYTFEMSSESKDVSGEPSNVERGVVPLDATPKGRWERLWPVIACGAGLFSDGYLNGVCFLLTHLASFSSGSAIAYPH